MPQEPHHPRTRGTPPNREHKDRTTYRLSLPPRADHVPTMMRWVLHARLARRNSTALATLVVQPGPPITTRRRCPLGIPLERPPEDTPLSRETPFRFESAGCFIHGILSLYRMMRWAAGRYYSSGPSLAICKAYDKSNIKSLMVYLLQ